MRRPRSLVLLVACLLASLLAFTQNLAWKEYVYERDGFAVSSPLEPVLEKRIMQPVAGEVEAHFYYASVKDCQLVIMYAPLHPNDKRTPEQALSDAKLGIIPTKTRLVYEKKITIGSYPGIEVETEEGQYHQRARFYAADRKMYGLVGAAPKETAFPADLQRWYESFRLLPAKK